MRLALSVCVVALCSSGCSLFLRGVERPEVTVKGVSLGSVSLTGMEGTVALDVHNPNDVAVPLSRIDWTLSVGSAQAASGAIELSETIPARGVAPVDATLRLDARDAVAVAAEVSGGASSYRLQARFTFSTKVGPLTVEVSHDGQLGDAAGLVGFN